MNALLASATVFLGPIDPVDLRLPMVATWIAEQIQAAAQARFSADHLEILGKTLASLFTFVDAWFSGGQASADLPSKAAPQQKLAEVSTIAATRYWKARK